MPMLRRQIPTLIVARFLSRLPRYTRPYQKATRHRATHSRKLLSVFLGARWKGRPIEPKNLYDGHRHAVSRCGHSTSAEDHLRMAGGDRRLEHSIVGELAGRSCGRCACIFRLYPEAVAQRGHLPVADERVELTRFRGAHRAFNGGFSDGQDASALFT